MADARDASDLRFDLLGHLLGALWHGDSLPLARTRFVGRGLKEGGGNAPLARKGNCLPLQFCKRDVVGGAIGFYFLFNELLFLLKHK
jgi:hypothetical protein